MKALVISDNQSFISQLLNVVGPLRESSIFSFPWDLKFKALLITKSQKLSFAQAELSFDIQMWNYTFIVYVANLLLKVCPITSLTVA